MPRRSHRPRGSSEGPRPGAAGWQRSESTRDGEFLIRTVTGAAAVKPYRCPGCQQLIAPGVAHLVVWPEWVADDVGGVADRRHWHTVCWQRRVTRGGPRPIGW